MRREITNEINYFAFRCLSKQNNQDLQPVNSKSVNESEGVLLVAGQIMNNPIGQTNSLQ